jgi:hypothetical protein
MNPTTSPAELRIHLPDASSVLDQDEEWCEVTVDGERRRIRLHDYPAIYDIPGLYEQLFSDELSCDSPKVVAGLLGDRVAAEGTRAKDLMVLDFGAGNGLVGEELDRLGAGTIAGVDLLEEARDAAQRDRPGVYDDYYACDMTDLDDAVCAELKQRRFNAMTCVAALGFGDVPPLAFAEAFNLVGDGGAVAFNIKESFLEGTDSSGFSRLIARMLDEGVLQERSRERYQHRLATDGRPLHYWALDGTKRRDVPRDWIA